MDGIAVLHVPSLYAYIVGGCVWTSLFFVFSFLVFFEAMAVFCFCFVSPELSEVGDITLTCAGAARSHLAFAIFPSLLAPMCICPPPFPATDGSHCSLPTCIQFHPPTQHTCPSEMQHLFSAYIRWKGPGCVMCCQGRVGLSTAAQNVLRDNCRDGSWVVGTQTRTPSTTAIHQPAALALQG